MNEKLKNYIEAKNLISSSFSQEELQNLINVNGEEKQTFVIRRVHKRQVYLLGKVMSKEMHSQIF